MEKILLNLKKVFKEVFKYDSKNSYFAPGRVNLIGEHTDYNGGNVFPCAIDRGTYGVVSKREDKKFRMYSMNFENLGIIEFDIDNLLNIEEHNWANYPKSIIWAFKEKGFIIDSGFDVVFFGNIPNGAGLSSSASLEVLVSIILRDLFNINITNKEIALISQKAENDFIGVNCGIMDQFAVAMGSKDKAIFLDTNTLNFEYVNFKLEGVKIVISNTNKRRGLADSKYNERRSECELAVKDLNSVIKISSLGELDEVDFEKYKSAISSEIKIKRAKHAVYENIRTKKAVLVLKNDNIKEFGLLMNASHNSLKNDYEVTGNELDTLVEYAQELEGVIGSRMTGAGFGGCTISLVKDEYVDNFIKIVGSKYKEAIGYEADFYVVEVGDGARKI
ncbi:MAG: galactokinase [Sarcina sp.]